MAPPVSFKELIELTGKGIELVGVLVTVVGVAVSLVAMAIGWARRGDFHRTYVLARRNIGRTILLGLEILVAGDIIRTVAVDPTLSSVAVLAAIVAIRTFLSVAIETEINGRLPWRSESVDPVGGS